MDPSKSPNAPPPEWSATGEKSSMVQPAPPPYQDFPQYPNPGYPQGPPPPGQYANPGYPAPSGYPQAYAPPGAPPGQQYAPPGQYPSPGQYPQGAQPAVLVQPTTVYVTRGPLQQPLPDYLCYSIFTMLCCCLPLGVAALIYSIFTRDANSNGQQDQAERNSRLARVLNHTGLGVGITIIILYIIYAIVLANSLR